MRKVLNNKVLLFIVAVLLASNIALIAYMVETRDVSRRNAGSDKRSPISDFLKNDIGFNRPQMDSYEQMRQQHRKKMRSLLEDIRLSKIHFYSLLSNATITDSALSQAAATIGEKQKTLELQTFKNFREIRNVSTAVQLPKYDSLIPGIISRMWFPAWKGNPRNRKDSLGTHHLPGREDKKP